MYIIGVIIGVLLGLFVIVKIVCAIVKVIYSAIKHPDVWSDVWSSSSCHPSEGSSSKSIAEQVRDGIALSDIEHGRTPGNWGTAHYYK